MRNNEVERYIYLHHHSLSATLSSLDLLLERLVSDIKALEWIRRLWFFFLNNWFFLVDHVH